MISVVIPLYNKANYIERALRSVQCQNRALCREIVVVDDGSTDGSAEVVDGLYAGDDRIKLLRQSNAGVSAARNAGIERASGEYVALLDADDQWQPWFLDEISGLIAAFPEAGVYCTAYEKVMEDGQVVQPQFRHVPKKGIGLIDRYLYASANSSNAPISASSVCVPRSHLLAVGGFPEGISQAEDKLMWVKLTLEHDVAWSPKSSMLRDMVNENQSSSTWTPDRANQYTQWLKDMIASCCRNGTSSGSGYGKTAYDDLKIALLAQREMVFRKAVRFGFPGYAVRAFFVLCFNAPARRIPRYAAILCLPHSLKRRIGQSLKRRESTRDA